MSNGNRILVVGPAWVGDMVMAQSLFMVLRERLPDVRIDVLAPRWSLPLLSRMPEVNEGICLPLGHGQLGFMARYRLGRRLRQQGYRQAIVTPRSWKAALVPFFARIPRRTGYRGEMRYGLINDLRKLDPRTLPQVVQRYVALGQDPDDAPPATVPLPALSIDPDNRERLLQVHGLDRGRPIVGLMPGAEYGPAKQWPVDHYEALARDLLARGYQVWVFGSPKERHLGERIARAGKHVRNLCGSTELVDVIDLVSLCDRVVTNDSGLMHVACATGRPVIAIYGSSSPAYTPPLSPEAKIMTRNLECSPCFQRRCPQGHTHCLTEITPASILAALETERETA